MIAHGCDFQVHPWCEGVGKPGRRIIARFLASVSRLGEGEEVFREEDGVGLGFRHEYHAISRVIWILSRMRAVREICTRPNQPESRLKRTMIGRHVDELGFGTFSCVPPGG
jgi:hypothetical protein